MLCPQDFGQNLAGGEGSVDMQELPQLHPQHPLFGNMDSYLIQLGKARSGTARLLT